MRKKKNARFKVGDEIYILHKGTDVCSQIVPHVSEKHVVRKIRFDIDTLSPKTGKQYWYIFEGDNHNWPENKLFPTQKAANIAAIKILKHYLVKCAEWETKIINTIIHLEEQNKL